MNNLWITDDYNVWLNHQQTMPVTRGVITPGAKTFPYYFLNQEGWIGQYYMVPHIYWLATHQYYGGDDPTDAIADPEVHKLIDSELDRERERCPDYTFVFFNIRWLSEIDPENFLPTVRFRVGYSKLPSLLLELDT